MSVPIIASAWQHFHKLDKQDFTAIMIHALSMSELMKDFNKKDLKQLQWLRDNTHKKINRSLFELDRYVDKTNGQINNNKIEFTNGTFTQDQLQNYLCLAVSEIHQIIYRNFKDYKTEEKTFLDGEETKTTKGNEIWLT